MAKQAKPKPGTPGLPHPGKAGGRPNPIANPGVKQPRIPVKK